ncbi:hypothetical protein HELRODRAFT_181163 [Helobdella robusta]|uniref:Endonuclease/exonuclease/phosphatase domain-containing protein n=1 Tax=Helobdella robusta TaxID=6412 RepID=T1FGP4_HELRO|nr:hypothetical protein HELRODRAFT_181163 [Helobdella robusta]ESN93229.1 hypothetical protein HELRODRAFT_181163 [Helobdella robusta]
MALSIRQKRVRRISGDPVDGVVVQGPVDGLATGTPLYSVAVQGTIDGRTTCRPRGWRFGTWNVGTLTGRSLEVVEELQRRMVDVAALQEVRWKGEGTRFVGAKGGRYKLWWKGDDGTGGVNVMVREELVEKVLEVRRRSNGVIVVVMVFGKVIVRVISGYAPQQSRKEEEKDRQALRPVMNFVRNEAISSGFRPSVLMFFENTFPLKTQLRSATSVNHDSEIENYRKHSAGDVPVFKTWLMVAQT